MTVTAHFACFCALWTAWVLGGILFDPIVAPRNLNSPPHTLNRYFAMWAYNRTLQAWIWVSRRVGNPKSDFGGKTAGEVLAFIFVALSRKWLRKVICAFLPPVPPSKKAARRGETSG